MSIKEEIEALLSWEKSDCYGYEEYLGGGALRDAAELIGARFVAVDFYGGGNAPYPAFERDGKLAYISHSIGSAGLEPKIEAIMKEQKTMETKIVNLTPHSVQVYSSESFVGLEQTNPTTWLADAVEGSPIATYESNGVARVKVSSADDEPIAGVPTVKSIYGSIEGLPEYQDGVFYIVSLPLISAALNTGRTTKDLLSPYQVVRSRSNGSLVLGCMGFARQ